ncbi:MAG: hypothetical protein K0R54_534 [Clostridiaceae bacterium]|jgi:hypothetical protein|nr:hypothetical protein [Clostridiaceae bacterium]
MNDFYTEEQIIEVIKGLLSKNENDLGFALKPGVVEFINKSYQEGQFGDITSLEEYIEECLYDYITLKLPINIILDAIEDDCDKAFGNFIVNHIGVETVVSFNEEFVKCYPAYKKYYESKSNLFYDLELVLEKNGYKAIKILEEGIKVKIKSLDIVGVVKIDDTVDIDEDYEINYLVIPEDKTLFNEIVVSDDDLEVLK